MDLNLFADYYHTALLRPTIQEKHNCFSLFVHVLHVFPIFSSPEAFLHGVLLYIIVTGTKLHFVKMYFVLIYV